MGWENRDPDEQCSVVEGPSHYGGSVWEKGLSDNSLVGKGGNKIKTHTLFKQMEAERREFNIHNANLMSNGRSYKQWR